MSDRKEDSTSRSRASVPHSEVSGARRYLPAGPLNDSCQQGHAVGVLRSPPPPPPHCHHQHYHHYHIACTLPAPLGHPRRRKTLISPVVSALVVFFFPPLKFSPPTLPSPSREVKSTFGLMKETLCPSPEVECSRDWKFSHGVSSSSINNNNNNNSTKIERLQTSYASLLQLCDRFLSPTQRN